MPRGRLFGFQAVVHTVTQILARFEMRHILARQGDRITGLGIAAHARRAKMQRETAEAANLDAPPRRQGIAHLFQYRLDGKFDVLAGKMALFPGDDLDQF